MIENKLEAIFKAVFFDDSLTIQRSLTAAEVPGWDSLNHVTLIVRVEQEFGIKFQMAEIVEMNNVGDLIDKIQAKIARNPPR